MSVVEQCLNCAKAFSFSYSAPIACKLGIGKKEDTKEGGYQSGLLTWTGQRDTPYNIMLRNKTGRLCLKCNLETGWVSICLWEVVSDCLCITLLLLFFFPSFLHLLNLCLSWPMSFFTFALPTLSPSFWGWVSEQLHGCLVLAAINSKQVC